MARIGSAGPMTVNWAESSANRLRTKKKRREANGQECREVAGSIGLQDRVT